MPGPKTCTIIGSGIAGPAAALSLARSGITCTIYELRDKPSVIGGAINLTPNGARILEHLGVQTNGAVVEKIQVASLHSGAELGTLKYSPEIGYAKRVVRSELHAALLSAAAKAGITVKYGHRLVKIEEHDATGSVIATFADGSTASADFLLGCDGTYSAVRTCYVEPERKPKYTGVANSYAFVPASRISSPLNFDTTVLNSGQRGSLLVSYVDQDKKSLYCSGVMSTEEKGSKEGWRIAGADRENVMSEMRRRYSDSAHAYVSELVEGIDEVFFYPVSSLGPNGKWHRSKVLLLGDAAHAMPPQGESLSLALEDAILFARILSAFPDKSFPQVFEMYERNRRNRIETAWKEATWGWENVKDKSWLQFRFIEWLTIAFLWWNQDRYPAKFKYDAMTIPLSKD